MEDKKGLQGLRRLRQLPVGLLVAIASLVLASGGATAWLTWRSLNPAKPPAAEFPVLTQPEGEADPSISPKPAPTATAPNLDGADSPPPAAPTEAAGQVFWVKDDGTRLALVPEAVAFSGSTPEQQLQDAFATLLSQPGDPSQNAVTTIPDKTEILSLTVESDGVHVDLSQAFTAGGGSASMVARLGQVVYTASALEPNTPVWISVAGKPLTVLGGEGIEVSQPITREAVKAAFEL